MFEDSLNSREFSIATDTISKKVPADERDFIAAIILQAVYDLNKKAHRNSAVKYFKSNVFRYHCELLDYDPDVYLERLKCKL